MDTFVVRVYRSGPENRPCDDRLRGVVEHIASGIQATFHDTSELLSILDRSQREQSEVSPGGHGVTSDARHTASPGHRG